MNPDDCLLSLTVLMVERITRDADAADANVGGLGWVLDMAYCMTA